MGKSLFIYVNGTWKECTPYLNVGSTWKRVLEFNAKTAEAWKPWKSEEHVHTKVIIPEVAPTCTATGLTEGSKCSSCGEILVSQDLVPATGHNFSNWSEITAPTEDEAGTKRRTCQNCDFSEDEPVAALGHDHNNYEQILIPGKAATCTNTGLTDGYKCEGCGETIVEQQQIPATGHAWGEWKISESPTCTREGEQKRECSNCSYIETKTISATGVHDFNNTILWSYERQNNTAATCTQDATYWVECRTCTQKNGDYFTATQCDKQNSSIEPKKALGHDWGDWVITTAATCTTDGEETRTCKRDSSHTETRPITALGHTVSDGPYISSSDTHHWSYYYCAKCETYQQVPGTYEEHNYTIDSGVQYTAATCTANRYNYLKCACGDNPKNSNFIVEIDGTKLDHDYSSEDTSSTYLCTAANCQSEATYYYKCSRCTASSKGDTNTTFTSGAKNTSNHVSGCTFTPTKKASQCGKYTKCGTIVTGHTNDVTANIYEPESETTHIAYRECEKCGYRTYGVSAGCVFMVVTDPTCTATGLKKCSVCKQEISIPATGHRWVYRNALSDIKKYPTCAEPGILINGYECSVCGDTYTEEEETPATGEHDSDDTSASNSTTCIVKCSGCGKYQYTGGHNRVNGQCTRCGL